MNTTSPNWQPYTQVHLKGNIGYVNFSERKGESEWQADIAGKNANPALSNVVPLCTKAILQQAPKAPLHQDIRIAEFEGLPEGALSLEPKDKADQVRIMNTGRFCRALEHQIKQELSKHDMTCEGENPDISIFVQPELSDRNTVAVIHMKKLRETQTAERNVHGMISTFRPEYQRTLSA